MASIQVSIKTIIQVGISLINQNSFDIFLEAKKSLSFPLQSERDCVETKFMISKKETIQFFKVLPNNIFAGFVVSLVALPLGLGLALASGAPPISGVVAAIVGGIIVSILGGSHVTITGPGNGLAVAVLTAITSLGAGDMYQGYLMTLAAIICSGALILILAFANLDKLSNFFPSTSIQGLLAAIGVIILSKQFHIMMGNMEVKGSTVELLLKIPSSIYEGFTDEYRMPAAIAGVASLAIMVFYSRIRNKYFQLIPAPMWIVMISIGMAYVFEHKIGVAHPISKDFFVRIPNDVFSSFPHPNFSKAFELDFIIAVLTITIIASIESLLSIKAVDKLDPLRRQSNINKDLKAIGLATIVSGFLGGLNVVTVIARSSVNVNNNGSNRSSNFFQAIFLITFILLFSKYLQHIPFPALAAILVFTGYKLASPAIVKRIATIGNEQLFIFHVTFFVAIFTNLITGIIVGILITFVTHIIMAKSIGLFLKNINLHNIETKVIDEKIHVKVKCFSSFLNFYRLKNILDKIEPTKKVVVDFLESQFIDHTVLEYMWDYEQTFDKNGGQFIVKGLEIHSDEFSTATSLRKILGYVPFFTDEKRQTRRKKLISDFCDDIEWNFDPKNDYHKYFLNGFDYLNTRQVDHIYNIASDQNQKFKFFDIEYSEGVFIAEEELHASMIYIQCDKIIPSFTLSKVDLYERLHYISNYKEIKLKSYTDFSQRFSLRGHNIKKIRRFFTDEIILFLESNKYFRIESNGHGGLLIMDKERESGVGEIKALVDYAIRLEAVIKKSLQKKENQIHIKFPSF